MSATASWSVLPPETTSPAAARRLVRIACGAWPAAVVQLAELLVSELVTNAVRYAPGEIGLRVLCSDPGAPLRVEVRDRNPAPPREIAPVLERDGDLGGGRGLLVVAGLAASWGSAPDGRGKIVWFELPPA